jgi:single-strand DNA-binding protein
MYDITVILGNVGRDPEMRYTPASKAVTEFSVAVTRGYGENKKTVWYNVTAWEKLAETCNTYVKKGMSVLCEGHVGFDVWSDKTSGEAKGKLTFTAHTVKFLGDAKPKAEQQEDDSFPF